MPRPDGCAPNAVEWRRFLAQIDKRVAERARSYRREFGGFSDQDVADAHRQFASLGRRGWAGGSDPDYSNPAVPFVYSLRFLPQRMTTVVSAFDLLNKRRDIPVQRTVLDVGSGLDSVSLALEACDGLNPNHAIVCVDASSAMHEFARSLTSTSHRIHETTDVTSFLSLDGRRFDSVFLSYAFSYEQERDPVILNQIIDGVVTRLNPGGFILYSGPTGKKDVARAIQDRLTGTAGLQIENLSSGWSPHLRHLYGMPNLQSLYDESFHAARRGGLDEESLTDLTNQNTGGPSRIFACTKPAQIVFSAHSVY